MADCRLGEDPERLPWGTLQQGAALSRLRRLPEPRRACRGEKAQMQGNILEREERHGMMLHQALRRTVREHGVSILSDKSLPDLLSGSGAALTPGLCEATLAIASESSGRELISCFLDDDSAGCLECAAKLRKSLSAEMGFSGALADYAVDSVLFAIGLLHSVREPSDVRGESGKPECGGQCPGSGAAALSQACGQPGQYEFERGEKCLYAHGSLRDEREAVKWLQKAASLGNAGAKLRLGWIYENGITVRKNRVKAAELYREAAEQGSTGAELCLARLYHAGLGVKRDIREAERLYRAAAEKGNPEAQFELGMLYESGARGIPRDPKEAFRWYRMAAEYGDVDAERKLGMIYECSGHCDEAIMWYRKAAEQGDGPAIWILDHLMDR